MKKSVLVALILVAVLLIGAIFIPKIFISNLLDNNMKITSSAFKNNAEIPSKYTCKSDNVSPPLLILDIPPETKTLILISDDPDAPAKTWVHWVVFNIPISSKTLQILESTEPQGTAGKNDFGNLGYGGPCPPSGTHRYFFKVFASNMQLNLQQGATKHQVEQAMRGHILASAELIGKYSRE